MNTLSEIRAAREAAALEDAMIEKIAEIRVVLGDDPKTIAVFDNALSVVEEEKLASDPIDALEKAAMLTYYHLNPEEGEATEEQTKEAAAEESEELSKEAQEAIAEAVELGKFAAYVAHEAGVTSAEVAAMNDAQSELFGRALAQSVIRAAEHLED